MSKPSITKVNLKIAYPILFSNLPGANELKWISVIGYCAGTKQSYDYSKVSEVTLGEGGGAKSASQKLNRPQKGKPRELFLDKL